MMTMPTGEVDLETAAWGIAITNGVAVLLLVITRILDRRVEQQRWRREDRVQQATQRTDAYIGLLKAAPTAYAAVANWNQMSQKRRVPAWILKDLEARQAAALSVFSGRFAAVTALGSEAGVAASHELREATTTLSATGSPTDVQAFRAAVEELERIIRQEARPLSD